jgi:trk system potassium uptake protein TrkH
MVVGGCAGSTAGGIKCIRAMMLIKQGYRELFQMIHPKAKLPLKVGKQSVPPHVSSAIFGFFFLYVLLVAVGGLFISFTGVDLITAYSAVVSALSNVGPGLGEVGPALNYAGLPHSAKILLASCMIIGRLEIMTVLVLFTRSFWVS